MRNSLRTVKTVREHAELIARKQELHGVALEGNSPYNGRPIVNLISMHSENSKTGDVVGTFHMARDIRPNVAITSGADGANCYDCEYRPSVALDNETKCYVNARSLVSMWDKYIRGGKLRVRDRIDKIALSINLEGRVIRFGQYGNPSCLSFSFARAMAQLASGHIGYEHGWRFVDQRWAELAMASVGSIAQKNEANAKRWRTFRVIQSLAERQGDEILCPADPSSKIGGKIQCVDCKYCDGNGLDGEHSGRKNVVIIDHGPGSEARTKRIQLGRLNRPASGT